MKATGTAGDITVLESPVDGVTVATTTSVVTEQDKLDIADRVLDELIADHLDSGSLGDFINEILKKAKLAAYKL